MYIQGISLEWKNHYDVAPSFSQLQQRVHYDGSWDGERTEELDNAAHNTKHAKENEEEWREQEAPLKLLEEQTSIDITSGVKNSEETLRIYLKTNVAKNASVNFGVGSVVVGTVDVIQHFDVRLHRAALKQWQTETK